MAGVHFLSTGYDWHAFLFFSARRPHVTVARLAGYSGLAWSHPPKQLPGAHKTGPVWDLCRLVVSKARSFTPNKAQTREAKREKSWVYDGESRPWILPVNTYWPANTVGVGLSVSQHDPYISLSIKSEAMVFTWWIFFAFFGTGWILILFPQIVCCKDCAFVVVVAAPPWWERSGKVEKSMGQRIGSINSHRYDIILCWPTPTKLPPLTFHSWCLEG